VLAVVREPWGWRESERAIPTKRFEELLGVSNRRVYQLREDAVRHNLIEVDEGKHADTPTYRVQKRYTDWLLWKSRKPWDWVRPSVKDNIQTEGRASVKDGLQTEPEGRASREYEGRASGSNVQIGTENLTEREAPAPTSLFETCAHHLSAITGFPQGAALEQVLMGCLDVHPRAREVLVQECVALASRHHDGEKVHLTWLARNVGEAARKLKDDAPPADPDAERLAHLRSIDAKNEAYRAERAALIAAERAAKEARA
jgi:hypothetical protein